jgi:hypothetical protein
VNPSLIAEGALQGKHSRVIYFFRLNFIGLQFRTDWSHRYELALIRREVSLSQQGFLWLA